MLQVNFVWRALHTRIPTLCQTSVIRVKDRPRVNSLFGTNFAFSDPPAFPGHGRRRRRDARVACATVPKPGATPLPIAADVPAERKAGVPSPDVEALLSQMTVEEKIGQMTQADMKALKDGKEVAHFVLGSVLSGADSLPKPNEPATWVEMYDRYQSQALSTRLGIPMLYGVDAVHGHGAVKGATIFPHNIGMGCTHDPASRRGRRARHRARGRGHRESTGTSPRASPCARDERWGRTYESFGETPELVASLGAAAIRGFEHGDRRHRRPRHRQALPRRRRHAGRQGPGRRAHLRGGAAPHPPARLRRRRSRRASAA